MATLVCSAGARNTLGPKAVIPEREFRSETPTDTLENEINVAEEASNYDQHDAPCENCQNMFNFHNDILCSMCDAGLFSIAKKEESICPSDINVKFAITNLKPQLTWQGL